MTIMTSIIHLVRLAHQVAGHLAVGRAAPAEAVEASAVAVLPEGGNTFVTLRSDHT